jgi:hypothetical protein
VERRPSRRVGEGEGFETDGADQSKTEKRRSMI